MGVELDLEELYMLCRAIENEQMKHIHGNEVVFERYGELHAKMEQILSEVNVKYRMKKNELKREMSVKVILTQ